MKWTFFWLTIFFFSVFFHDYRIKVVWYSAPYSLFNLKEKGLLLNCLYYDAKIILLLLRSKDWNSELVGMRLIIKKCQTYLFTLTKISDILIALIKPDLAVKLSGRRSVWVLPLNRNAQWTRWRDNVPNHTMCNGQFWNASYFLHRLYMP